MTRTAEIHRMVTPDHVCPYGLKSVDLLEREGFEIDDHHLESKQAAEEFKRRHGVETTPQTWIDGERIGGHDALLEYFGKADPSDGGTTYRPVVALFAMSLALSVAIGFFVGEPFDPLRILRHFAAIAMSLLALQKLQDVESFSTMFLNYDLLARRQVPYSYAYPYGEGIAGVLMLGGVLPWLSAPIALFIGTVGAVSVFKAVYIDKRELKCACVGGDSKVPLGFVSLTENLVMIAMGVWTGASWLLALP